MELVNLKEKPEYTFRDIKKLLRISNTRILQELKEALIYYLDKRNIEYDLENFTLSKKIFERFFKTKKCKKIIRKTNGNCVANTLDSREDILSRELMSSKDIEILLDCGEEKAERIANEIKKMMQVRGVPLLLDHFLTSYFLEYIKYKS